MSKAKFAHYGLVQDGVAIFEPDNYDSAPHTPSPIFLNELKIKGDLPSQWKTYPKFFNILWECGVRFDIGDADLYGTGEVRGNLRRNGDRNYFWNTENPAEFLFDGKKMYQSQPWVMGVRKDGTAFGIIADTSWESSLFMIREIIFKSKGPAFRVVVIEKDNPAEVLKTLADLTGKMELPPLWSLGYQQCRYSYYPQELAAGVADTLREHNIPCDVLWLDIHYMDQFKIFTFNPKGFNRPEDLNAHLHKLNMKAVYMIDPGVKAEEGYFVNDQGVKGDYFVRTKRGRFFTGPVWPGECHFPDFTNPKTCKWWAGLYKDFMARGIDGVWNDMNEPSVFNGFGTTIPKSALHKGGGKYPAGTHHRYHNIYGYLMAKASREGIMEAQPDKRPFVLSRANFLGGQRYAAMWTGDNFSDYSQMKESIPMCLNISLSGQPFNGPDIGGFMRNCTPDLLRHWTACGIYFPFARNHAMLGTANQEPWAFDKETEDICRRAIERRYRLLPYYYTLFEEASRTGIPVMRPAFWADFKDTDLRSEQQVYLVGNDLLVIPRWSQHPVLPKGDWKLFSFEEDDDHFQAYLAIRPGSAIPLTDVVQSTMDYNPDEITVLVNPDSDGKAVGEQYVDEGNGFSYRNGNFARYEFQAVSDGKKVKLSLLQTEGSMKRKPKLRIAIIRDGKIVYSQWSTKNTCSIDMLPEAISLEDANLKFVHLIDFSISKTVSKLELILKTLFKGKD